MTRRQDDRKEYDRTKDRQRTLDKYMVNTTRRDNVEKVNLAAKGQACIIGDRTVGDISSWHRICTVCTGIEVSYPC